MYKRKEYPIKSYVPMRTNKDRTCICCGDTIPAGSSRMIPRHAKANHGLCFPCFRKWRDTGGDLKLMDNPGDAKKEHVIHMSNILKGNCDIIKGRKLYVAFKKAINGGKKIVIKFDTDQPISMSTRVMNPSFGEIIYLNDIWKCIDKDNRFTPIKQLLGYYYYVEVYKYQNIDMVSESANLVKLYEQKQIANDVVFEMIFHPNGNLNGSWVDDEDILLAYNPYKS